MKHLASSVLVMLLALAPAVAEETSIEKNESIERYMLVDEQVASKIKSSTHKIQVPSLLPLLRGFSVLGGANNHPGQVKLFILYHNLKLCD